MTEFIFYLGAGETRRLINRLLGKGYTLVPKVPFPLGPYPRISKLSPDEPIEKSCPNMSLMIFGSFSAEDPVIRPLPSGKLARVSDNQGGPMIALNLPGSWPLDNGLIELSPGMLSLQKAFWSANLSKQIGPTPELKRHYIDLVDELKHDTVRLKGSWIGAEAIDLFRASKAVFRPRHLGGLIKKI
jgi:hypothetical protein